MKHNRFHNIQINHMLIVVNCVSKLDAIQLKGDKCFDCNTSYPYQVYDFHHLDQSQKDMDWTKLRMFNIKRIHDYK